VDIHPVITHRLAYTEFQKGFQIMREGEAGKVILDWEA
jgi:threonine 3-dehydrogenase